MGREEEESSIAKVTFENKLARANLVVTMDAIRVRDKAAHLPAVQRALEMIAEISASCEWGAGTRIDWEERVVTRGARTHKF